MKATIQSTTPKKHRAIIALLDRPTLKEAAETVGVGESTLFRWLKEPDFAGAYREARTEAVRQAIARLQQITSEAVEVLRAVMNDKDSPPSSRVTAARTVIEQAIRAVELEELQVRVEALEKALQLRGNTR